MGHVERYIWQGDLRSQVDGVVAFFRMFQQYGCRRQLQRLRLVVCFRIHQLENTNLVVVDVHLILLADVRQLITLRIHNMEVGVGNEMSAFRGVRNVDMAFKRRYDVGGQIRDLVRGIQQGRRGVGPV